MNEHQWYDAPQPKPVRRAGRRAVAGIASLAIAGALSLGGYAAAQAIDNSTQPATVDLIDPSTPDYGPQLPWGGRLRENGADADKTEATAQQQTGVVLIDTEVGYGQGRAAGGGIVLTNDGYVLTNHHVIESATSVKVTVESTGQSYTAEVVGSDSTHDVALLKLKDASGLTPAAIDDDGDPEVGDEVTTVGNSNGGGELLAANGTVTGLDETITAGGESGDSETLNGLIQADVDVVSGDSGGAMLDDEGEVVGMTTAASTRSPDITGYAIDIDDALKIVQQIRSGDETGSVTVGAPAFLGVQVDGSGTATIAGTVDDSPAASSGLRAGDTITRIGNTSISSADDLVDTLGKHNPGDKVTVSWTDSAGETHSAEITLAAGPAR